MRVSILIPVWFACFMLTACDSSQDSATGKPTAASTYCWKKGTAVYRDRNHDGQLDWEVSGEKWRSDAADIYKMDTNYDGFYDLEESFGYGISGKPTTG